MFLIGRAISLFALSSFDVGRTVAGPVVADAAQAAGTGPR